MLFSMLTLSCLLLPMALPLPLPLPLPVTLPAKDQDGSKIEPAVLDQARRRLAEIELLITVDRDIAGAETALVEETARWQAETPALLAEPEVVAARLRIERLLEDATRQDSGALADAVREALYNRDERVLRDIGPSGVGLVLNALDSGERGFVGGREFSADQLVWGGIILDGDRLVDHLFERWRSDRGSSAPQVIYVLRQLISRGDSVWSVVPGYQPKLREPAWLDMLTELLADSSIVASSDTRSHIEDITSNVRSMNAFTPELGVALADFIMSAPSRDASRLVGKLFSGSTYAPTAQPILDRLLADPRQDIRRQAAAFLTSYPQSDALLGVADDPDPAIRLSAIAMLGVRTISQQVWMQRDPRRRDIRSELVAPDPLRAAGLLSGLAADPEPVVREAVLRAIDGRDLPIDPEVFRRLSRDPDPGVRSKLVEFPPHDASLRVELLTELARDADIVVTRAVDQTIMSSRSSHKWADPDELLPVVRARFLEAVVSVSDTGLTPADNLLRVVGWSKAGRVALARWTMETGDSRFLEAVLPLDWAVLSGGQERKEFVAPWLEMSSVDLVALLGTLEEISPVVASYFAASISYRLPVRADDHITTFSEALSDGSLSVLTRIELANLVAARSGEDDLASLREFLRDPAVIAYASDQWMPRQLERLAASMPATLVNGFLLDVLRESSLPDRAVQGMMSAYRSDTLGAEPLILEIIRRWLDDPDGIPAVSRAVGDLASVGTAEAVELLLRSSEHPSYIGTAVEAMGRLRDPAFLARLEECLRADWLGSSSMTLRDDVESLAASAVAAYMTEEAAEMLLRGAATVQYPFIREKCLAGAEMIHRYLDGLDQWQRRKASRATRESAITELLPMLEDKAWEVRLEAARALGTLGAVEHMPKLIALLRDPESRVREAAHGALDRLNAEVMVAPADEAALAGAEQASDAKPSGDG